MGRPRRAGFRLEDVLLGYLRRPASGWDLHRLLGRTERLVWAAEPSQIYPALRRLEAAGLVTATSRRSRRGPPRVEHALTERGREHLAAAVVAAPDTRPGRVPWRAQLRHLAAQDDPARITAWLESLADGWRSQHEEATARRERIAATAGSAPDAEAFFHLATLELEAETARARIAWCERVLDRWRARREGAR